MGKKSPPSPPQLSSPKLSMIELAQLGNLLNLSLNPLENYDQAFPQFLKQQALLPGLTNFARAANQANQSLLEQLAPGTMRGLSSAGERISGLVSDSDTVRGLARPVQDNAGRMAAQSQTAFDNASRTAGTVDNILANARRTGQQADPLFASSDQIGGTVQPVLDRANAAMASGVLKSSFIAAANCARAVPASGNSAAAPEDAAAASTPNESSPRTAV